MTGFSSWKIMSSQTNAVVLSGIFPLKGLWCLTRRQGLRCAHKRQQPTCFGSGCTQIVRKTWCGFSSLVLAEEGREALLYKNSHEEGNEWFSASAPSIHHAWSVYEKQSELGKNLRVKSAQWKKKNGHPLFHARFYIIRKIKVNFDGIFIPVVLDVINCQ